MIRIDGSFGEGGGQILRYAACFAAATSEKVEVYNIRAKRPNPGLRPQHLAVLNIMKKIFGGEVYGAKVGSTKVVFNYGDETIDKIVYNVGTAGSITLIMQSIIPALSTRKIKTSIRLIGGTDVKWSPTTDYMKYAYKTLIEKFGVKIDINIIRRGYYPRGEGIVDIEIECNGLKKVVITERGEIDNIKVRSVVSNLPRNISIRQTTVVKNTLNKYNLINKMELEEEILGKNGAIGPGVSLLVVGRNSKYNTYSGGDSIGEKGKPAEKVGQEAVTRFLEWYTSGAAIDVFQGDMIIPYIALSGGGEYTSPSYTRHMESALYVMKEVLRKKYEVTKINENLYKISIY